MNLNVNVDLEQIQELVLRAFQNPTADLVSSAFVLSAILVALLMLVLVLLLLLTPKKRKIVKIRRYRKAVPQADLVVDAREASEAAEAETSGSDAGEAEAPEDTAKVVDSSPAKRAASAIVAVVFSAPFLLALALAGGYWVSGTDDFCARTCHAGSKAVYAAGKLDHASCAGCHEKPGVSGVPANAYSRASMGVSQLLGRKPDGVVVVDSEACLRCHESTIDQTVETQRGIRVSHKEPNEAGATCVSCHATAGHEARRDYSMSSCLPCHGGGSASTECSLCHTDDPYDARARTASAESTNTLGSGDISYPIVRVANRDCGGCHDQERECDTCHGLRMPHSDQFKASGHARSAAFEKKQMCYKCHEPLSCTTGCHIGPFPGHYANFKQDHKKARKTDVCGCHAMKSGRTEPMCVLCHDF